ncbi:MAG: response regulator [SAR324 cluster bacterium]|nr:response regulator [SAR324 cluster bacterium]
MAELREYKLLAIDDSPINLEILVESLGDFYDFQIATNAEDGLELIKAEKPDLILLDVIMPGMSGFELCEILKSKADYKDIPIIFLTGADDPSQKLKGFEMGAVDYVTKPLEPSEIRARIKTQLEVKKAQEILKQHNFALSEKVAEKTRDIQSLQDATINLLANLAEYRDPETGGHVKRTQNYVKLLAQHAAKLPEHGEYLTDETIELLFKVAPLHDIGKVGVRDHILLKPGKLTAEEFEQMKLHPQFGRDAIESSMDRVPDSRFLKEARALIYTHHEKWDGTGYPEKIKGEQIPLSGRLMAIADVYDALVSRRMYKAPFSHKKAAAIIEEGKGTHFDPQLVDIFLKLEGEFKSIALELADSEEERSSL